MAWEWSHTQEAYANAFTNLAGLPLKELRVIFAEWAAETGDGFDRDLYDKALAQAKGLTIDALVQFIWDKAEDQRTCTNGGWEAWVCPEGCHTVSFTKDSRLYYRARQRGICD